MDEWRDIDGFFGYSVKRNGQIRSFRNSHGGLSEKYHILKPRINPNGYQIAVLYDERHKAHQLAVHRLVAEAFVPNPFGLPYVDHIDGNKKNNDAGNLEWVSEKENSQRAVVMGLYEPIFDKTRRPVMVTDTRNGEQLYFKGVNDAARELGFSPAIISRAANMKVDRVGHYQVEFIDGEDRLLFGYND